MRYKLAMSLSTAVLFLTTTAATLAQATTGTIGFHLLLGDGSAQQVSSASFRQNWLRNAADSGLE